MPKWFERRAQKIQFPRKYPAHLPYDAIALRTPEAKPIVSQTEVKLEHQRRHYRVRTKSVNGEQAV